MTWTAQDHQFMSRAIQLARNGHYTCDPNPRVGCVITDNDKIIGEGWHAVTGEAHAEINALNSCNASGSTVYITLEPCSHQGRTPPCVDALIQANIKQVIVAMLDPNPMVSGSGIKQLKEAGIKVDTGLLEAEAKKLNPGFIKRMESGLPYCRCKMAMSIDGRTALKNGESQWISSVSSRRDVHRLRAASGAVLTSVETVIKDDPLLNVRDVEFEFNQPLRVIIDRKIKIPEQAKLFSISGKTIIYTQNKENGSVKDLGSADVVNLVSSDRWLEDVFLHLAREYEINEVLVETGPVLAGKLINNKLVDEIIIYMAPILLGHDAKSLLKLPMLDKLGDAVQLNLTDVRQIEKDLRLTCNIEY
ncbi:MAG: bifunctional diaminohydroxyphosphoribosylaminopyrimidine deaminase/5-amino-6-(5-phosphoribosylamino)uracil reductase RibD [Proteobacteria bacterium]|nr:bifunctional diaminohydroxyphosphoribosylaminopyrimidine deaminase/5-amino-6-(5-phosphoribosylamino)uracil reductase RibD [Pseudomonadota bacterium]